MVISDIFRTFVPVKEKVTDISEALKEMASEMRSMRETIDAQQTEIHALNRNLEGLRNENRSLRERLAKYEKPDKNSGNSSTPPSKEKMKDEVVRRTRSLRKPTGRKPGGQPGHEGHVKEWFAEPDTTEDHLTSAMRHPVRTCAC